MRRIRCSNRGLSPLPEFGQQIRHVPKIAVCRRRTRVAHSLDYADIHFPSDTEDAVPIVSIDVSWTTQLRLFTSRRTSMKITRQPDLLILKLIEKLSDADPITRRNATGALRLQGMRAVVAIPAISALLADQDPRVRHEAERAIDHLKLVAA